MKHLKRKICSVNLTVVDCGDSSGAEGHVEFHGNGDDMVHVLAHLFTALELEPTEALHLSLEAAEVMRGEE